MSILRLSHVEIRVPDLELATAYYSEVVGLIETAREPTRVFLKCWDEHQHHSVVLSYAPTHGLGHFGFKVTEAADLDAYQARPKASPCAAMRKPSGGQATARPSGSRCMHHPDGGTWQRQDRPVVYEFPWRRDDGTMITDYVEGQDIMAWVSQGTIVDRSQEHLGRSDAGVAMLRKMFKENMQIAAGGGDPLGTVRIPHEIIELPCEKDKFGAGSAFTDQWINGGSMRYAPIREELLALHRDAAVARAQAGAGG
jgi:catechol 2,3-dioxygenase-like lactoylglutathione lyase family enzyme